MWRVVVRLTCIVMGGVLVVMTLGIGVRRDDTLPRLLLLQRPVRYSGVLIAYHPETKQWWSIGDSSIDRFYGVDGAGRYLFRQEDDYLYSQFLLQDSPTRISSHKVTHVLLWASDRKSLVYISGVFDYSDLYSLQTDGTTEYLLNRELPDDYLLDYFNMRLSYSPDGKWVVFDAYAAYGQTSAVYRVRIDGTGLQNVSRRLGNNAHFLEWLPNQEEMVISTRKQTYIVNLTAHTSRRLIDANLLHQAYFYRWIPETNLFLVHDLDTITDLGVRVDGRVAWAYPQEGWSFAFGGVNKAIHLSKGVGSPNNQYIRFGDIATGKFEEFPLPVDLYGYRYSWSLNGNWVAFYVDNNQTGHEELWKLDVTTRQFTLLWWTPGGDIFEIWVSPDGQEILVDAATPTWAGLLRMNPDGSDVRELTSVQDIELGEHDFVDWATLPDRAWQPVILGGGGIGLVAVGLGWPIFRRAISRRRHLA